MPVSLCEWRVRIGRFVHQAREYVIRERKEKLLMERIRRLKLLHKRLLEKGGKSEHECESDQNELSAKVDNAPNKSSIINNDKPTDCHEEDSCSSSESTIEENTTNRKSNGDGSEFPFHFLLLALFSLLFSLIFFVVDFSNLLESSKPLLNLGGESTWRSTCLRIIVCSSLACILLSCVINTNENVQDNLVLIGNENAQVKRISKTNKTESTNNENNTTTGTTIKSDISSTESNVKENNTQIESAIGKNYTLTDSRIREKNTTTKSTKYNIPMNATITKTNTPSTTRDLPSESKQSETQTSKRKNIKEKNTMTELTTRENSTLPESTIKDNIAPKECHIDTPSFMKNKPSKRKTSKRKTLKENNSSSESTIEEKNTTTESTIKDRNSTTESTIKHSNTPSTIKDKSSKRKISNRKTAKVKNIATGSQIKVNTTTSGSTSKEKSASSATKSAIKYNSISTESTIKDKNTTTKSTIKHSNSVTESIIKESSTVSNIKDKLSKRKISKRKTTKYKSTATKSKIKGNTTTTESTIKDNSLTESTINDYNSTSESTIKDNTTTTESTNKDDNSVTESTVKKNNSTAKFVSKGSKSTTECTFKNSNAQTEFTVEENNTSSESTIKEENSPTESDIKVHNTTSERTLNCNDTTTESTIKDRNSTTESTIQDYNRSSESTMKDTKTPNEPTIENYNTRIELNIKDITSTIKCTIKEKNTPTESPIKGNNSTSESALQDINTTNKSAIKEKNTSSRTPTEENNNQSMKVNIAQAEYTIRSGIQKGLSDEKHGISSQIPSSLKGTTGDPVMQESTCLPEMILIKAGDVEQNPGPFDRSTQIQEQELVNLAYDVPSSKYTELCIALGVSYNQSQTILDRHHWNVTISLIEIFCEWKNRQRDGTDCREDIAVALRNVNLDALGDKLSRGGYLPQEEAPTGGYLPQEAAPTASIANEKKPLTTDQVTRCGDDFKTFYRTQLFKIKTDPLNFSLVFEFERIYTDLVLLRNEEGTTKKTPLDYNKLLKTEVNGELPKRLMVEGEGGAGKTTFCSKMAWDWTNGADDFQEFVWVIVIHLRDIDRNQTVGDIARTYLSDSNSVQPHQIDEYILANPSKVFIILDGLDEYNDDLIKQGNDIAKIIRSEKFKECRVLVTTRPWKADQIKSNSNFMKAYAFIAVAGFDIRHISIYINKYFSDDSQASRDLVKLIEENDVIQENMAPFPIYITMLCILWRDSDSKKRELIRRLKTFSQLFQEIIISLNDHYVSKQITDLDKETVSQYEQLDFYFSQIGKIALSGIMNKKLVYGKEDFSSCEEAMVTCCRVGVLSHETRLVRRQDRHIKSTILVRENVFFPHKLFQEYFAGMYLASLFKSQYEQYKTAISDVIPRAKEFRYLLYFTVSQSKDVGIDVTNRIINKVSMNNDFLVDCMNNDFLVDIAFEAFDEDAAKMVRQRLFAEQKSLIINNLMSAHTVSGYLFIIEKIQMETLIVTERSCGPTVSRDLADVICSSTALQALELSAGATFHDDFYGILGCTVNTSKIEKVCIDGCILKWSDPSRDLAKFLCRLPCLTYLTIKDSAREFKHVYFHDDFYHEIGRLASSSKIEKVCIDSCDLQENDPTTSRDLAKFLCHLPCLTDLTIKDSGHRNKRHYLHDHFYNEIARLASSSKIEKVCIDGWHPHRNDPTASRDLAKFLCLLPCLTDLTIKGSFSEGEDVNIHCDFYHEIARLASSTKIEKVYIAGFDLLMNDPTASRDLAMFVCLLPCLTDLTIKDSKSGDRYRRPSLHDAFYHELTRLASSSKIQTVNLDFSSPYGWIVMKPSQSASKQLAKFLCSLPSLTNLVIDMYDNLHDDFFTELDSFGASAQVI